MSYKIGTIHEDVTTDVLGKFGKWQCLMTFVCTLYMMTNIFDYHEDMPLLKPTNNGPICVPEDEYVGYNATMCFLYNGSDKNRCTKWHVRLLGLIWLNRSWEYSCDDQMKLLSIAMICRLGSAFGCVVFGLVADSFGRKRAMIISLAMELPMKFLLILCDSEGWFRLLVFLRALFGGANIYMGLLLTCEIASNTWRTKLMAIVMSPRAIAAVCTVPLANCMANIDNFGFAACLCSLGLIFVFRWLTESPQWLLHNRNISAAEKILYNAATQNGMELCEDFKIRPVNDRAYESLEQPMTCIGVLTTTNIRVTVLVIFLIWIFLDFLWSSLYLQAFVKQTPMRLLLMILGAQIILGCLNVALSFKLKLRHMLLTNTLVAGVLASGIIFSDQTNAALTETMFAVAISCGTTGRLLIGVITPRLFSINIRATSLGSCFALGQSGSMISYLIFLLEAVDHVSLSALILAASLSLCALCLILPDVDSRELPDVMQDMDYFLDLTKPLRWATQKTNSPSLEEVEIRMYSFSTDRDCWEPGFAEHPMPPQPHSWRQLWRRVVMFFRHKSLS